MIYTFYSFKGGVGRTMALANIAELLYRRGLDVLMVDFDLEAPGLEQFFDVREATTQQRDLLHSRGVVDLIVSYKTLRSLSPSESPVAAGADAARPGSNEALSRDARPAADVQRSLEAQDWPSARARLAPFPVEPLLNFVKPIYSGAGRGSLSLMPAGRRDDNEYRHYVERVRSLDWADFYVNWGGQEFFDWFIEEAKTLAHVVLIDSRTGITEMGGICTHHLADAVVLFVAPNEQNLDGVKRMIRSLTDEELVPQGRGGRPLPLVIVPSRVESGEGDKLDAFAARFQEELAPHIDRRLSFQTSAFVDLKIPYVLHYSYMEEVAVRDPDRPKAADLIAAYTKVASALVELAPPQSPLYKTYHAPEAAIAAASAPAFPPAPENFTGRGWVLERIDGWLGDPSGPPVMLLTGEPGSGKTALAARLVEMSQGRVDSASYARLGRGSVSFAFACGRTPDEAIRFVTDCSRALAARYPGFALALTQTTSAQPDVSVRLQQKIGTPERSAQYTTLTLQSLELGRLRPAAAFRLAVLRPLQLLYQTGFSDPIFIVVDAVDAAAADDENVIALLAEATSPGALAPQVRFLLTSRRDARVLQTFSGQTLDLGGDIRAGQEDIAEYAYDRLGLLPPSERAAVARRLAQAAAGNFLFVRIVVAELLAGARQPADVLGRLERALVSDPLPTDLRQAFRQSIKETLGLNLERWAERYRPVLGALAAAREPLGVQQLAGIVGRARSETADVLRAVVQYLDGPWPDGPFRLFHTAFAEFLLNDPEFGVDAAEIHLRFADYFIEEHGEDWTRCNDNYALSHTAWHLLEAGRQTTERRTLRRTVDRLGGLFTDFKFLQARTAQSRGIEPLRADVDAAVLLARGEPVEADLRSLGELLRQEAKALEGWDSGHAPNLFDERIGPQAKARGLTRLAVPAAGPGAPTEERIDGPPVEAMDTKATATVSARGLWHDVPFPVRVALELQRGARRAGKIWMALSLLLCGHGINVALGNPLIPFPWLLERLEGLAPGLYVTVVLIAAWSVRILVAGESMAQPEFAVAGPPSTWESLDPIVALRSSRAYRLAGTVYIASPFLEAATALYLVTALVMTMSPQSNPVALFRMLRRAYG